jgi:hypothetical protein
MAGPGTHQGSEKADQSQGGVSNQENSFRFSGMTP